MTVTPTPRHPSAAPRSKPCATSEAEYRRQTAHDTPPPVVLGCHDHRHSAGVKRRSSRSPNHLKNSATGQFFVPFSAPYLSPCRGPEIKLYVLMYMTARTTPLTTTRWAGRFTPCASVVVVHRIWMPPSRKRVSITALSSGGSPSRERRREVN